MKIILYSFLLLLSFQHTILNAEPVLSFGGNSPDEIRDMAVTSDGGVIVTGIYRQVADFDPSAAISNQTSKGNADIFIAKYDKSGKLSWVKSLGGPGDDQVTSLFIDFIGDIYITGSFTGSCDFNPSGLNEVKTSKGVTDAFVGKYTSNGDFSWVVAFGGTSADVANDCFVDIVGSVTVIGSFNATMDVEPTDVPDAGDTYTSNGMSDIFLVIYSDIGEYETGFSWGSTTNDEGTSVTLDEDLNFLIAGNFTGTIDMDTGVDELLLTSSGSNDCFIAKYDLIGNLWWAFKIGGNADDKITNNSLCSDMANNIYVTGYFSNSANFNPSGTTILTSKGKSDIFVAKYDETAVLNWANTIGSVENDKPYSMSIDKNNNIFLNGSFTGTVDFNPGTSTKQLSSISGNSADGFFGRYGNNFDCQWICGFGNTDQSSNVINFAASTMQVTDGSVFSAGTHTTKSMFYNSTQQFNLDASGTTDCYLAFLDAAGIFKTEQITKSVTILTPNGGEIFNVDGDITVSWVAENIDTFDIALSTDGGSTYTGIFQDIKLSQSPLTFKAPNQPSKKCKIQITGNNDRTIIDESDNFFEIKFVPVPIVNIRKPNGGEIIIANTSYDISWQAFNIDSIGIFFSSDNGINWSLIEDNYQADIQILGWKIPDINSDKCLIKITNSANDAELDRSEGTFTITNDVSVDEGLLADCRLTPNPAISFIQLNYSFDIICIKIFDLKGTELRNISGPFAGNKLDIDIADLSPGIYLLVADVGNNQILKTFVKSGK